MNRFKIFKILTFKENNRNTNMIYTYLNDKKDSSINMKTRSEPDSNTIV